MIRAMISHHLVFESGVLRTSGHSAVHNRLKATGLSLRPIHRFLHLDQCAPLSLSANPTHECFAVCARSRISY